MVAHADHRRIVIRRTAGRFAALIIAARFIATRLRPRRILVARLVRTRARGLLARRSGGLIAAAAAFAGWALSAIALAPLAAS